ncbi:unnamed protein product [Didymodactylos carnosus]|uniref:Uncharacterized protein n=1 Tax=Didymodactylos carnosus TaxID=1234261 RepID=A0A815G3X4_9BILA|nr:unnamed protein product [Didymodactylos carnosus]CAF1333549.1 unnamed protein product [Didymodactylos carnosus]CAF3620293.1 unnamed protein product [Didymodactylos carnosus]CAF4189274.1 unnamed protein product [Didymodactylos carnosus]
MTKEDLETNDGVANLMRILSLDETLLDSIQQGLKKIISTDHNTMITNDSNERILKNHIQVLTLCQMFIPADDETDKKN